MTKADLITIIADKLKFPWARAELLVDVVFDCMEQSMSRGEKIEIRATRPTIPYRAGLFWQGCLRRRGVNFVDVIPWRSERVVWAKPPQVIGCSP
jgi:hypothetical protein